MLLENLGLSYWWALILAPLLVGAFGMVLEKTMLKPLYKLDHLYGLLLTFGLALILEGVFREPIRRVGHSLCRCRRNSRAARISASCSCPSIAAGW